MPRQFDWGPLYLQHRGAMHAVARAVLRGQGLTTSAEDVVNDVMVSLIERPPEDVRNWEAFLVSATKKRAIDLLRSAPVRRNVELEDDLFGQAGGEERIDSRLDKLAAAKRAVERMGERERFVIAEYVLRERDRASVADDLGVSPARVSQIMRSIQDKVRAETAAGEAA